MGLIESALTVCVLDLWKREQRPDVCQLERETRYRALECTSFGPWRWRHASNSGLWPDSFDGLSCE